MLGRISLSLLLIPVLLKANFLSPAKVTKIPLSSEVVNYFCAGDFGSVIKEGEKTTSASPAYVSIQMVMLSTKEGMSAALLKLNSAADHFKGLTQEDRLVIVSALLRLKSLDESRMRDLMSFKPSNLIIGAYQKVLEGDLLLVKYPEVALKNYIDGFNELPYLDSSLLSKIFQMAMRDKNAELILEPFLPYIDQLPESSPDKYVLMAYKEFLRSKLQRKDLAYSYVKHAYELCRYDQDIALFHASNLMNEKNNDEAEKVLLDQVRIYPTHSPYADLFLAKIYAAKNDKSEAMKYIKMAEVNKAWLVSSAIAELELLSRQEDTVPIKKTFLASVLLLGVLIAVGLGMKRRKRKNS